MSDHAICSGEQPIEDKQICKDEKSSTDVIKDEEVVGLNQCTPSASIISSKKDLRPISFNPSLSMKSLLHVTLEPEVNIKSRHMINGIQVIFPGRPYPSQIAIMSKVIEGLKKMKNCILDSPTGSGKSLAILCSTLAWQHHEKENSNKLLSYSEEVQDDPNKVHYGLSKVCNDSKKVDNDPNEIHYDLVGVVDDSVGVSYALDGVPYDDEDDEDDDFVHPVSKKVCQEKAKKNFKPLATVPNECQTSKEKKTFKSWGQQLPIEKNFTKAEEILQDIETKSATVPRVARIFYATRTHKQIEQVIRELGKTEYKDVRMTVLSSREHSCISTPGKNYQNKTEMCKELLDPLNMNVKLSRDVVILDEAHNIEDISRESANFSLDQAELKVAIKDITSVAESGTLPYEHNYLAGFLSNLCEVIESCKSKLSQMDSDQAVYYMDGTTAIALFSIHGIGVAEFLQFKDFVETNKDAIIKLNQRNKNMIVHLMSASSFNILERLCLVLNYMYRNSMANRDDYRVTLIQTLSSNNKVSEKKKNSSNQFEWRYVFNWWCQNPAIVFQELAKNVRCIILTSGTLTPIDTFKSELGTDFPIQLEANHVLSSSQLWVGTVPCGPNNKILNARFKNVNTYEFQDELGQLVLEVCNKVPYGVLVFLPSYKLLDMLVYRWKSTQLWDRLQMVKEMLTEPHKGRDLYYTMDYFYQAIRDFESLDSLEAYTGKTGPCLLAVMRGKVAEGLDFSDNNARAIITVGIPFSNVNNLEVKLKMEYNDKNRNKGLLKGADWYRIQAFRALNQALGRCLRHKYDWGALLLVDDRFQKGGYNFKSLSKMTREHLKYFTNWSETCSSLSYFIEKHSCTSHEKK